MKPDEYNKLIDKLKERFENNMIRHRQVKWIEVQAKLERNPDALCSLGMMEKTGGEPDVIGVDPTSGQFIFCDCSKESPTGRRSLCYDHEALISRKHNRPVNSVCRMAEEMGIELLTEDQYFHLQRIGNFDTKTSSWLKTPPEIRKLGGAIFGDFRYGRVFIYQNGAESYYSSRGFRGVLKI